MHIINMDNVLYVITYGKYIYILLFHYIYLYYYIFFI